MTYHEWVEHEAILYKSDRCTLSIDWNVWCCLEHDLSCLFGKDPRDAYRLWKCGETDIWLKAKEHQRRDADKRFWKCNREMVKKHHGNFFTRRLLLLRTDVRYLGVRVGAIT